MDRFRANMAVLACLLASNAHARQPAECLTGAIDAARWLATHAIETEHGLTWPVDPENEATLSDILYSGASGVVLFHVELFSATDDEQWLPIARAGADNLIANLPKTLAESQAGLYTGVAGIGFVLHRVYLATDDQRYLDGARECVRLIRDGAIKDDAGVTWGPVTDIIGGDAGVGLFLLYAHEEMGDETALDLASGAGRSLLSRAIDADTGLTWRMTPDYERLMPNFSHGTAGIAFFLARLHEATGEGEFLDGAWQGVEHLRAVADTSDNAFAVHHHTPDGEDLYYLGWCHGPIGTSRAFEAMQRVSALPDWATLQTACAQTLKNYGVPETRSPGYWENVSRCCGTAGMGDYFLARYQRTGDAADLAMAQRCVEDLMGRATRTEQGLKWVQAEHRVRPDFLVAQTGLAQGSAGIGLMLLRCDAAQKGRDWTLRFPDETP